MSFAVGFPFWIGIGEGRVVDRSRASLGCWLSIQSPRLGKKPSDGNCVGVLDLQLPWHLVDLEQVVWVNGPHVRKGVPHSGQAFQTTNYGTVGLRSPRHSENVPKLRWSRRWRAA